MADQKKDSETLVAWIREGADEIENAHLTLDMYHIDRAAPDDVPYTLAARVAVAMEGRPWWKNAPES